ncbi:MAG TPA: IS110 family transposase, partial [Reyranella sp.]|nr:IS110 family transposase [Reyranella sp.]HLG48839.1 IS110 family transposase [Reyranella sp.]
MSKISRLGIDTSKSSFELCGVDDKGEVVLRKTLRRK